MSNQQRTSDQIPLDHDSITMDLICFAEFMINRMAITRLRYPVGSKLNCPVYVARHLSGFLIEFYMGFSCLRVGGGGG